VKSLIEEASLGISQASLVETEDKLAERVQFIHGRLRTDAIVEQFITGREVYVSVLGNRRLQVFPIWELLWSNPPKDQPLIATRQAKWTREYQKKRGIHSARAENLPAGVEDKLIRVSKRIYRTLGLSGYARLDFRIGADGEIYFLEANPNPQIAADEDFADSARAGGVSYSELLERIVRIGLNPGL
jgi:D-alanine-D-alanine ligase